MEKLSSEELKGYTSRGRFLWHTLSYMPDERYACPFYFKACFDSLLCKKP
jgi:hypothetical protein